MKKKIEKIQKILYVCEICGKESEYIVEIQFCEKTHSCNHKNIRYNRNPLCIEQVCTDCGKNISSQEIPYESEKIEKLFIFLKKLNK